MLKKIGGTVLVLFILSLIYEDSNTLSSVASAEPDFYVSCAEMYAELQANGAAAFEKYAEKITVISGRVTSIEKAFPNTDNNIVALSNGSNRDLGCYLNDVPQNTAVSLAKDQVVSFKCYDFDQYFFQPSLSLCSIYEQ